MPFGKNNCLTLALALAQTQTLIGGPFGQNNSFGSMKTGGRDGQVVDPFGQARSFSPEPLDSGAFGSGPIEPFQP